MSALQTSTVKCLPLFTPMTNNSKSQFLSIIIPTLNRASLLRRALESLVTQTYSTGKFEVIVVDNGSLDDTKGVCRDFESLFNTLKYIYEARPGLHVGRHAGLKIAEGEILVYCDDDIRAFSTWIEGIAESFQNSSIALVGGKILPDFGAKSPEWFDKLWWQTPWGHALGWYSLLDFGDNVLEISPEYVWGCNFSIRKTTLLEVGGFHPDSMPSELIRFRGDGETAVSMSIKEKGYHALYNPKASVYHFVSKERMTLDYLYTRAFAQGVSDSYSEIRANRTLSGLKTCGHTDNEVQNAIANGLCNGFNFHQKAVSEDQELFSWVLKANYF
jgi:glucosyl-dolichyl phosphate glucuronosyltransferase